MKCNIDKLYHNKNIKTSLSCIGKNPTNNSFILMI